MTELSTESIPVSLLRDEPVSAGESSSAPIRSLPLEDWIEGLWQRMPEQFRGILGTSLAIFFVPLALLGLFFAAIGGMAMVEIDRWREPRKKYRKPEPFDIRTTLLKSGVFLATLPVTLIQGGSGSALRASMSIF
jgi:hypothetical protein